jgi:hypothetical protein
VSISIASDPIQRLASVAWADSLIGSSGSVAGAKAVKKRGAGKGTRTHEG